MTHFMHRFLLLPFVLMLLLASAGCGYTWRGQEGNISPNSVLGDGSKTLRIRSVEQTTLYAWIPYIIRSQVRDEISSRGLAKWVDSDSSDFTLGINVLTCSIRSNSDTSSGIAQLSTATIHMVFSVYDGHTNKEVWKSGLIAYSDNFEYEKEETVVKEVVRECVRRGMDRLQQRF